VGFDHHLVKPIEIAELDRLLAHPKLAPFTGPALPASE
jgi:hypothetical protein